jgi:two-component system, OmpR family, response regulator
MIGAVTSVSERTRLVIGTLAIDKVRYEVKLGARTIVLTPTEFALLWRLALEPGRVFRRDELLGEIWGKGVTVEDRTVDTHMSKVRRKLRQSTGSPSLIETVWGMGYRLKLP